MIFILRGTTCSGKDTFIRRTFCNTNHVLSSDDFREMLLGDRGSQQHNKRVFSMMHEILEIRFLNRVNWTVFNATNLRFRDVQAIVDLCKKYRVPFTFISIAPPPVETLYKRNIDRHERGGILVPYTVIDKHHARYETAKDMFIKEAMYDELCTWIEIDQNYDILRYENGQ